ncbi:MAG: carbohydrate kinase [Synergistaceae bacterium]|jgi:sugar/nucleoside kinase (ribokinase family)|nr:carbohydrate kinase [Synergistaceae bacterium]
MKPSIVCVGEIVIDFISGGEPCGYIGNPGGAPANVAVAISRLGIRSAFCGKVGDDDFGRLLLRTLREDNVDILGEPFTKDAFTTLTFVTLSPGGERSFSFARKPGADMLLTREDIPLASLQSATIVHAGSCSLSGGAARQATHYAMEKASGFKRMVSFDVNYRAPLWESEASAREEIHRALPYVDLLKVSDEEAYLIGGAENIPDVMKRYKITAAVLTLGKDGSICHFGGRSFHSDGYAIPALDTTGAGDAFWACFLMSLLDEKISNTDEITLETLKNASSLSNLAGSICVRKKGAVPSFPTRAELERAASEILPQYERK